MAHILDGNGDYITQGLQGCSICDDAILAARAIARDTDEPVWLSDDDGNWKVNPDGSCTQSGTDWMDDRSGLGYTDDESDPCSETNELEHRY